MTIVHGELFQLSEFVHRITAANPGLMTGPGTNTYLLGRDQLVIVDPGPNDPLHIEAIVAGIDKLGASPQWIFVTHTHPDHSPGAAVLAEKYGIPVWGNELEQDGFQDESFKSDFAFQNGQKLVTPEVEIQAIHTPGHVSNHFCFIVASPGGERFLLTGDHIMQGSTVVIIPPAGDMKDYMESLERLLDTDFDVILPAHGTRINDGVSEIRQLLAHRLEREAKVANALAEFGVASVEMLVKAVYTDVDESLHAIAALSLEAHLIKLQKDSKVSCDGDKQWRWL